MRISHQVNGTVSDCPVSPGPPPASENISLFGEHGTTLLLASLRMKYTTPIGRSSFKAPHRIHEYFA